MLTSALTGPKPWSKLIRIPSDRALAAPAVSGRMPQGWPAGVDHVRENVSRATGTHAGSGLDNCSGPELFQ